MEIKKERGLYVCPHNEQCRCEMMKCSSCGWNPEVAKERLEKYLEERKLSHEGI